MKNITKRISSAAVLILILVYLTQNTTTNLAKIVVATLLSLIIVWEYSRLFKSRFCQVLFQMLFISLVFCMGPNGEHVLYKIWCAVDA